MALDWSAGGRVEQVRVDSDGGDRFGAAQGRRFTPKSLAFSGVLPLAEGWSASANLNRTERAPAYYELFASGLHLASAAFEQGDATLGVERAKGLDLGLKWESSQAHVHLNVYETRFDNYIALQANGTMVPDGDGGTVPFYAFHGVPARLRGVELEARWQVLPMLALLGQMDAVRGGQPRHRGAAAAPVAAARDAGTGRPSRATGRARCSGAAPRARTAWLRSTRRPPATAPCA